MSKVRAAISARSMRPFDARDSKLSLLFPLSFPSLPGCIFIAVPRWSGFPLGCHDKASFVLPRRVIAVFARRY
jgi:hypothetical protein